MKTKASRYHDFSTGHRVYGHESKCAHLHGHNYRVHFEVEAQQLDSVGRVMDFSVIKEKLCEWLEENWDHKFLVAKQDPFAETLKSIDPEGVVVTEYNPTAENMGAYLMNVIGPKQLENTNCTLVNVAIEETRKCTVSISK